MTTSPDQADQKALEICAPNGYVRQSAIVKRVAQALRDARQEGETHPIEKMPNEMKDGRPVLLWLGEPWSKWEKARWYEPWSNWQCGIIPADPVREDYHGIGSAVPTHYRELPPAPKEPEV